MAARNPDTETVSGHQGCGGRPDFVEFRNRIKRLVGSSLNTQTTSRASLRQNGLPPPSSARHSDSMYTSISAGTGSIARSQDTARRSNGSSVDGREAASTCGALKKPSRERRDMLEMAQRAAGVVGAEEIPWRHRLALVAVKRETPISRSTSDDSRASPRATDPNSTIDTSLASSRAHHARAAAVIAVRKGSGTRSGNATTESTGALIVPTIVPRPPSPAPRHGIVRWTSQEREWRTSGSEL